jgi:hypothetical protein
VCLNIAGTKATAATSEKTPLKACRQERANRHGFACNFWRGEAGICLNGSLVRSCFAKVRQWIIAILSGNSSHPFCTDEPFAGASWGKQLVPSPTGRPSVLIDVEGNLTWRHTHTHITWKVVVDVVAYNRTRNALKKERTQSKICWFVGIMFGFYFRLMKDSELWCIHSFLPGRIGGHGVLHSNGRVILFEISWSS